MKRGVVFAIPGDLQAATGGYAYDREMIAGLRAAGWEVEVLALSGGFPAPTQDELDETRSNFASLGDDTLVLVDGLAFGAMPQIAEDEADRLRLVALVHHPLALETGLSATRAAVLEAGERRALAAARAVIATSTTTANQLAAGFGVSRDALHVVLPGTEAGPRAEGAGAPPVIVCIGSLIPRKGQDVLVEALSRLRDVDWQCRIVGSAARDEAFAARVRGAVEDSGLSRRVALVGEVADARAEMAAADIFALPTRHEGYGMVFAEAMTHGLPIVGTSVGAVPEVVPPQAGTLTAVDDAPAFAAALGELLRDARLRRAKAEGSFAAGRRLPDWATSAGRLSEVLRGASA